MIGKRRRAMPGSGMIVRMDVLSSRVLIRPTDPERSRQFYRQSLSLAVYREFGDPADPGLVFFLGGGFLEVSGLRGRLRRCGSTVTFR